MDNKINGFRSINHIYQGKSGGVEQNTNDDVLTRRLDKKSGEPVMIYERAGNKNLWQKVRNTANKKQPANAEDVKHFLMQRGMNSEKAGRVARSITSPSGTIRARDFEDILQGRSPINQEKIATEKEDALYKPTVF